MNHAKAEYEVVVVALNAEEAAQKLVGAGVSQGKLTIRTTGKLLQSRHQGRRYSQPISSSTCLAALWAGR